ncbi:MAG: hypothetical protein Q9193_003559 [Seirophora villosa]
MASRRLVVRTFTVFLNADKPALRQRFEVPELESWDEFLSRLKKASDLIPSPMLPTDANKNGLTVYEDRWSFSLLQEKGRERSAWMDMDTEYIYEWMKDKLLEWNTEWKAVMINHVGPNVMRQALVSIKKEPEDTKDSPAGVEDDVAPPPPAAHNDPAYNDPAGPIVKSLEQSPPPPSPPTPEILGRTRSSKRRHAALS